MRISAPDALKYNPFSFGVYYWNFFKIIRHINPMLG